MTAPSQDPADEPGLAHHSSIDAVRTLYDRWAGLYDWNPVMHLVRPARRRAVAAMGLSPGDIVVDMGTGTGANLPILREAVGPNGEVIGIDVSPRMLERAQDLVDEREWRNVTLVEADIRDPPLDAPVDGILSTFVVVMYADPGRLVEGWVRHLDGGTLANLYAGPSTRRSAPVVNGLLSLYLRLFEAGWDIDGDRPIDVIARRGERARAALQAHADRLERDAFLFGLAHLDVGRVRR